MKENYSIESFQKCKKTMYNINREVCMSTWRDIWRYGVIANRFYSENEERGERAFRKLMEVYDKPEKNEKDGMIRYIMAEAYESKYHQTNNKDYQEKALDNYEEAANLFPVKHWKKVANDSFDRLSNDIRLQDFYKIRIKREPKIEISADFKDLLWYGFQKVYTFTHLNDFARYVCLSAFSRGDTEWPLSLVDFRTVLELEINQCFPEIVESLDEADIYSLYKTIDKLEKKGLITNEERTAFDNIRIAGNIATHKIYLKLSPFEAEKYKKLNIVRFIDVLSFFNDFRRKSNENTNAEIPYPLCQINIERFCEELDKEKK